MRTTARIASALLSTTFVVAATATASFGQSTTVKDKSGDVVSFADQTTDETGTQLSEADSVASGVDLRSMRVKHTKKSVGVRLRFSNLAPGTTISVSFRVEGKSAPSRFLVNTGKTKGAVVNTQGKKRCSVPVEQRYGASGTINAAIKRSCLGNPKRIKVTALAADQGFLGDNTPFKIDSISRTSVRGETWTKWLKAS